VIRRRRVVLASIAALCLALAAMAALAAADVGAWRGALRAGDVADAAGRPGAAPAWHTGEDAPFGIARRLLGIDDDLAFRRAFALFQRAHTGLPSFDTGIEGTALRVQAEAALARVIRSDRDRRRASAAANLLGVLAVLDSTPADGSTSIDRGVFEFQDAVRLDPTNEEAKTNLELVYQLTAPPSSPRGNLRRSDRSHSGATAILPGQGY
jgi:hypothetical protein